MSGVQALYGSEMDNDKEGQRVLEAFESGADDEWRE